MKIVINIPKEKYQVIKTAMYARVGEDMAKQLIKYIKNGKPLKQEPKTDILDKIRAEMFEEMLSHSGTGEEVIQAYVDGLKKGIEIIDKYKAESEEVNGR